MIILKIIKKIYKKDWCSRERWKIIFLLILSKNAEADEKRLKVRHFYFHWVSGEKEGVRFLMHVLFYYISRELFTVPIFEI